jgi:hypothetical protein
VTSSGNGTPRTATYTFAPPGGAWSALGNGTYTVSLNGNQVKDVFGHAALAKALGTFQVAIFTGPVQVVNGNVVADEPVPRTVRFQQRRLNQVRGVQFALQAPVQPESAAQQQAQVRPESLQRLPSVVGLVAHGSFPRI